MKVRKRIAAAVVMMVMIVAGSSMSAEAAKFNPAFYAAKYADVRTAFGTDVNSLYNHYITYGQKEGRMPDANAEGGAAVTGITGVAAKFNPAFYAAEYADVRTAFGTNAAALYNHYISHGQKEGRMPYAGATGGESVSGIATAQEIQAAHVTTTYYVKYIDDVSTNDFRYQTGNSTWQNGKPHRDLYYLQQSIKDGDVLIVDSSVKNVNLKVSVSLSNVTFVGTGTGIVTAKSVENAYVLRDSIGVINGNVTNAYVYDNAIANFNNDVEKLYVMKTSSFDQCIGVGGTVGYAEEKDGAKSIKKYYSFLKGKYSMKDGVLKTASSYYSLTPSPVK